MDSEFGYMILTDEELSEALGMSPQTIKKYNKRLVELGYLEIITKEDGTEIKKFNLEKL